MLGTLEPISAISPIAQLNDRFRQGDRSLGHYRMSRRVLNLSPDKQKELFQLLQTYQTFSPDDQEHRTGVITLENHQYIWKIDYLDLTLTMLSDEPANPEKTSRVLLIIRADEQQ
jgi:hypothetical protein